MTRRIKRHKDFELTLQIKNDDFIRPPRDSQRGWLINRAVAEFVGDLEEISKLAKRFVPGVDALITEDRTQARLSDEQIMEDWQLPLMLAMAEAVTVSHGRILEIGFGRGVASTMIQNCGVQSHTIIECNDSIVERYETWREEFPGADTRIVHGLWQDSLAGLGQFDGIFFHTYPLNEIDFLEQIGGSTTFADHFFPHASRHLVDGGVFTYLSNEIDSLSRAHQRLLFREFSRLDMRVIQDLAIPDDVHDAWWSDSMVVIAAYK